MRVSGKILLRTSNALWKHMMLENYTVGSKILSRRRRPSTEVPALAWWIPTVSDYRGSDIFQRFRLQRFQICTGATADAECSAVLHCLLYKGCVDAIVVLQGLLLLTSETLQCCSVYLDRCRHFSGAVLKIRFCISCLY